MSPENYATRPLRPLFDTHGDAGVYLIQMQTDAQQEPFTSAVGPTQAYTGAGDIASDVWDTIQSLYANHIVEAAVLTPTGISALIRLYEPSCNEDSELDDTFFADHADECPCCAELHALIQEEDDPNAFHYTYEFYGSAAEFVMEVRSEIARAVWSRTGQRGTQFWSTILLEPVADIPDVLHAHRAAMAQIGIELPAPYGLNEDESPTDWSQN